MCASRGIRRSSPTRLVATADHAVARDFLVALGRLRRSRLRSAARVFTQSVGLIEIGAFSQSLYTCFRLPKTTAAIHSDIVHILRNSIPPC